MTDESRRAGKTVEIEVDGEELTAPERDSTPREIIDLARDIIARAGKDPAHVYLVELKGKRERTSYKDRADEEIRLHEHQSFITVSLGPTPVS
jgi:hypothetical protein